MHSHKTYDYLIVGLGLAGIAMAETLRKAGKTFLVMSNESQRASVVAGGLYNPTILKRFTLAWEADKQLEVAIPFYEQLERHLHTKLDYPVPILKRFAEPAEHNLWFEASEKMRLAPFLNPELRGNKNEGITAEYKLGLVEKCGRVDTPVLIASYAAFLKNEGWFIEKGFEYNKLKISDLYEVSYEDYQFQNIIFCEGYGLHQNPFFDYLPLNGTKGELLTIHTPLLKERSVIKSSVFIIPLGDDLYRVGATYKWKDKTNNPTTLAREELLEKLNRFLKVPYEVVDHVAGIRPTVADRRPLVGQHPESQNLYVLNGLGSRGVLTAPWAAKYLLEFIEENKPLHPEMDIERYRQKYQRK